MAREEKLQKTGNVFSFIEEHRRAAGRQNAIKRLLVLLRVHFSVEENVRMLTRTRFSSQSKIPARRLKPVRMSVTLQINTLFNGVSIFSYDFHNYKT